MSALANPPRIRRIASSFEGWLMAVIDVAKSARLQSRSSLGLARAKLAQALLDFPIAFAFRVVEPLLPFCGLH